MDRSTAYEQPTAATLQGLDSALILRIYQQPQPLDRSPAPDEPRTESSRTEPTNEPGEDRLFKQVWELARGALAGDTRSEATLQRGMTWLRTTNRLLYEDLIDRLSGQSGVVVSPLRNGLNKITFFTDDGKFYRRRSISRIGC